MALNKSNTIIHLIVGLNDGGAEAVLFRLCAIDRKNTHIVISMMDEGKYGSLLKDAGVKVYTLNMPRGKFTWSGIKKLWYLVRLIKPEVMQTWMYHANLIGGIIGKFAGVKRICWGIHHVNLDAEHNSFSTISIARLSALFSMWIPDIIISCSIKATKVHKKLGYKKKIFKTIANGYDLKKFQFDVKSRKRLRAEWNIPNNKVLFGMVARFHSQKDHKNLLSALSILKNKSNAWHCMLIGNGINSDNALLLEWIQENNLEQYITLLGQRTDIADIMNAIDIHLLSSLGEGFPNVLSEAMACRTPCITTDVGDAAFIVGDTGWVVKRQNSSMLADAILDALCTMNNKIKWLSRCLACQKQIEDNFTQEQMLEKYQSCWTSAKGTC